MIKLENVQKVVEQRPALDIQHLEVCAGETAAIVGPPGSGKQLLLDLITGQTAPSAGSLLVAGLDPVRYQKKLRKQIGVLFLQNGLYDRLSARANLAFHCRLWGLPQERGREVLSQVGLADQAEVTANHLSPGLARRLAFGRAILHQPSVLLLSYPFANCDSISSALLARLVRQLSEAGTTILILDTDEAGLSHLCREIHFLEQGRIVRSIEPQEVRKNELTFKVPARQEGQVVLVNPGEILYASAEEGQTFLHTVQGNIPSHLTLTELEERLAHNGFFRAHRGYLVNLQRVKAVIPYTRDSYTLVLDDPSGTEIPLSKTAARELRDLLGY